MFEEIIQKCILQVRRECSFFGSLMLFAQIETTKKLPTAATDGRKIFFNEEFLNSLSSKEQNALMLHEVLHMALLHVTRRQNRDPHIWNIAADIVVNDLIERNTSFPLPQGAITDTRFQDKSVEYIYEALLKSEKKYKLVINDILQPGNSEQNEGDTNLSEPLSQEETDEIESFWKDKMEILKNSSEHNLSNGKGSLPAGIEQEISTILEPEVDWRHALWKYVGKTPADFDDLDRRFIYKGLYLESLLTEAVEVSVCIDTSGSVSDELLMQFTGELKGILRSYPNVKCSLFFADTDLAGPYEIDRIEQMPKAIGRGGTSFVPFFDYLKKHGEENSLLGNNKLSIYFTDGFGDFPQQEPDNPTMWLVCKDGLETNGFPFGEVVRISTESGW
ncbi:VWA-like domain-containing protein [Pseudomonadota bacterium]|nr:VWA-like domain-containing protein [Pseudomonadota bacterium]